MQIKKIKIFLPARDVGSLISPTLRNLEMLYILLTSQGVELEVRVIDDGSKDDTEYLLQNFGSKHSFFGYRRNSQSLGNAINIQRGWQWALEGADASTLVVCCDADGEHNPLDVLQYLHLFSQGYDGVVGSIIYPPHRTGWADQNTMRSLGAMQAKFAGANDPFYIQSPGFQIHKSRLMLEASGKILPEYLRYLQEKGLELPRWGMHGAVLHLIGKMGARLHSAYLPCFGDAPNRSEEKLALQANACHFHLEQVEQFWREVGSGLVAA